MQTIEITCKNIMISTASKWMPPEILVRDKNISGHIQLHKSYQYIMLYMLTMGELLCVRRGHGESSGYMGAVKLNKTRVI